jgi:RND family efflux transporter MFP subunit
MTGGPGSAAAAAAEAPAPVATIHQPDFWSELVEARTSDQLCRAWLGILCEWVPGTQAGLVLLHDADERYAPAAAWPDPKRDLSHFGSVAESALVDRRGVVRDEGGSTFCAYPLLAAERAFGVVVLQLRSASPQAVRDALRLLHWGAGWLVGLFDRRDLAEREQRLARSGTLHDLMAGALAEHEAEGAARWIVNRLAEALPCRTALIGHADAAGRVHLAAVSGSAGFEPRSNLLAAARDAMQEAVDAGEPLRHPRAGEASNAGTMAQDAVADFAQEAGAAAALALPLELGGRRVGALLIDFAAAPGEETVTFACTVAAVLAPAVELQRRATRSTARHLRDAGGDALRGLLGPRRAGWKLIGLTALVALMLAAFVPLPYRIGAPAVVEGTVQRAAVAPFAGYVQQANSRAGDKVKAGDLMARLDDRDLKLEASRWQATLEVAERKLREALARGTPTALVLARAEVDEATAELALVNSRLARLEIKAPFDGVVVRGDLSQQLGAPVEAGKVLFEVAPLNAWRVVLRVDERDILRVRQDAAGELVLTGLPGVKHAIRVAQVAPVAQAEEGRNTFRIEAAVPSPRPEIQPGMEGVGKIEAGERSALWIMFHRLGDWLSLAAWKIGF